MFQTLPRALRGSRSGAGGSAGTGRLPPSTLRVNRRSGQWAPDAARFFCAREAKEAAGEARTSPPSARTETKAQTKARGCPCGWRTWTRFTRTAWRQGSTLPSLRPTCRGACAKCICGTRMVTCFGLAKDWKKSERGKKEPADFSRRGREDAEDSETRCQAKARG